MKREITIYCDGSCNRRNRLGGIGAVLRYIDEKYSIDEMLEISRGYSNTTNNRMELRAILLTLQYVNVKTIPIKIYSDSQYVVKSLTIWYKNWERFGYSGIKNSDLIKKITNLINQFENIQIYWIKGHTEIIGNEKADELANYHNFEYYEEDIIEE